MDSESQVPGKQLVSNILMKSARMKLYVLANGILHMDRSWFVPELSAGLTSLDVSLPKTVAAPVYAVLIEHPEGVILFDTGCHPDSMGAGGRWAQSLQSEFPWSVEDGAYLHQRLEQLNIRPSDIRYTVASHLHCDHAGNIALFPHSATIVHEDELSAAQRAYHAGLDTGEFVLADLEEWHRKDVNWKTIHPGQRELKLASGVRIHNLGPGHSYGMLGLQVDLNDSQSVFLASDAAYSSLNYGQPPTVPKAVVSKEGYVEGTVKVKEIADGSRAEVWYGHDMSQFQTLVLSTEGWYE
ncbi:N-acyl homoserine lactonase family protein [Alicyclobacillus sp. SO9]|uniref:N-acyl homoserine lactonase family protein n=1 Tax=Alicyclobacillus sp. SO9 TaxID=2665646 RepID=UPI0018E8937F|nr:N-acyl homoserine lactonase family protein [Alicyclobacillus sp. SO9]QQE79289.1 N-acyl homoserine lactonase family protein [Alicyclobacillus sp. SO9]